MIFKKPTFICNLYSDFVIVRDYQFGYITNSKIFIKKNPNNELHALQVDSLCQKSKSMIIFIQLHGIRDASYSIT
jgi:hypothetical protein